MLIEKPTNTVSFPEFVSLAESHPLEGYWYIASPYSSTDAKLRDARGRAARVAANRLMHAGVAAYVPIAYGYGVHDVEGSPVPDVNWYAHGLTMLNTAVGVAVLMIDGWNRSTGVVGVEIPAARMLGMTVVYVEPDPDMVVAMPEPVPAVSVREDDPMPIKRSRLAPGPGAHVADHIRARLDMIDAPDGEYTNAVLIQDYDLQERLLQEREKLISAMREIQGVSKDFANDYDHGAKARFMRGSGA